MASPSYDEEKLKAEMAQLDDDEFEDAVQEDAELALLAQIANRADVLDALEAGRMLL